MKADQPYDLEFLAAKYREGLCSDEEKAIIESWMISRLKKNTPPLSEEAIEAADTRMHTRMQRYLDTVTTRPINLWPRYIAAAVALLILGAGLFYFNYKTKEQENHVMLVEDIAPGKQGATLTLANGTKISLSEAKQGKLAEQSGVTITKNAKGELVYHVAGTTIPANSANMLTTSKGETYQLQLPDGSTVWLNAVSSLTYSVGLLENGKRRVKLEGEGFFKVTKDSKHPFVVLTGSQEVEVLGTEFNVNSYPEEGVTATTLVNGSVKVSQGSSQQIIKPGEQAINTGSKIRVAKVNLENYTDWKDGDFNLVNLDFDVAMRKIARWYDVEVVYEQPTDPDLKAWGLVSRDRKLSEVLGAMQNSGIAHFRVKNKTVYISK